MYTYCGNNPVNRTDPSGEFWGIFAVAVIAVAVIIGGILGASADEPLLKKSQDFTKNKHKDKNPVSNSKNGINNNSQVHSSNSINKTPKLSAGDRAMNVFIGATLGLAVGGATVATAAMPLSLVIGLGEAGKMFALGALAFNAEAIIFAPFYSVELEPIEWETPSR